MTFKFCDQCGQKLHLQKATKRSKPKEVKRTTVKQCGITPESSSTQAWFWGSQALPSISLTGQTTKPHREAEPNENQREEDQVVSHLTQPQRRQSHIRPRDVASLPLLTRSPRIENAKGSTPNAILPTPRINLVWGPTLEKAIAELKAKDAMLAADIVANTQILAHVEAQAQAHAFQNDDVFKFACQTKRELERAIGRDKAALQRVRDHLSQLAQTDYAVTTTKHQIERIAADEAQGRLRRASAACRISLWFRRHRQRRFAQTQLRIKVCRGYIRYRYVKRPHDVFPGQFFYVYDRKVKATQPQLEFVGDSSTGVYRLPFHVFSSPHPPERLVAAATRIQGWYRRLKTKWRCVLVEVQRVVVNKQQAAASQRNAAATKLQALCRSRQAKRRLQLLVATSFEKCVDPTTNMVFFYNAKTQTSQWTPPRLWKYAGSCSTPKMTPPLNRLGNLDAPRRLEAAAVKIQSLFRKKAATNKLKLLVAQSYQKVFDPETNQCYYYNTKTNSSQWVKPTLLGSGDIPVALSSTTPTPRQTYKKLKDGSCTLARLPTSRRMEVAAVTIQGLYRTRNARRRLHVLIAQTYQKVFDADTNMCYYYNAKTGESHWTKPRLLGDADIPNPVRAALTVRGGPATNPSPPTDYSALPTSRRVDVAAMKIQSLYRVRNARRHLRHVLAQTYQKVLDADSQQYYYYNSKTGQSQWTKPVLLGTSDLADQFPRLRRRKEGDAKAFLTGLNTPRQREAAATKLQGIYRVRLARRRLATLIASTYQKFVDADSQTCYYYNLKTGESSWVKPALLRFDEMAPQT
ncbi:hypothetical protein H310_00859 [Aphanomyces invadans]|uniref:Probable pectate lyase F n=1 Tax=Aphanomyces invadans TaxID=157072 RepID=A0A024UP30_9STRA|nr:hypothetical protein H310_00859 [Aphanomyces invadans]ETW08211.1 hypothetical protein H310_00859 [Aphanomyces invadans]|eukprot:XP_008862016.1 hypothetical protein H310_00859 [Aphanomyces invadans]